VCRLNLGNGSGAAGDAIPGPLSKPSLTSIDQFFARKN
jgi:hypothetical protein